MLPIRNPLTQNLRPQATPAPTAEAGSPYALQGESGALAPVRRNLAWVETPPIAPGQTMSIDIQIGAADGSKARSGPVDFSVFTVAAEDQALQVKEWKVHVVLAD